MLSSLTVDYDESDPVHQWSRMPSCDEFVGSGRSKHTAVAYKGAVYVFGGDSGKHVLNDLLRFDVVEKSWVRAFTISSHRPPSPRYHHSAVVYNSSMYIFGGYTEDQQYATLGLANTNDLYEYSFKTGQWIKWMFKGPCPVPRSAHGAVVYDNKLWILAGYDGSMRLNDMWNIPLNSYTVHTDDRNGEVHVGQWEEVIQSGECPPTCCNFPVAVSGNSMYVFSGHSGTMITNSLYRFDFASRIWTRIDTSKTLRVVPPSPIRRYGHTMVEYDNDLYVFGGTADSNLQNNVHRFDVLTSTWSVVQIAAGSDIPPGRLYHSAAVEGDCMYIFGGTVDFKIRSRDMFRFKFSRYPRCSLHEDFGRILESKMFADVEFLIGPDKIKFPCHIALVSARSPWLAQKIKDAMRERWEPKFRYLSLSDTTQKQASRKVSESASDESLLQVYLPDIVPDAFEMILEYIYLDRIDPTKRSKHVNSSVHQIVSQQRENDRNRNHKSVSNFPTQKCINKYLRDRMPSSSSHTEASSDDDESNVLLIMDVYLLAKQMELTHLQHLCLHYTEAMINKRNVLLVLRAAASLDLPLIKNMCLKFIVKESNYGDIVMSSEFETLDRPLVVEIVREKQTPGPLLYVKPKLEPGHSLEHDMAALLDSTQLADFTLVVRDRYIPTHKAILAARSGFFEAMFRSFMPKDNIVRIKIGDVTPSEEAAYSLLKYIYSGDVSMPPQDSLYLYFASHFYSFTNNRLQVFCKENLEMNITPRNVLDVLEAANELKADSVKNYALRVIRRHYSEVSKMPKLRMLNPLILLNIMEELVYDMDRSHEESKNKLCTEMLESVLRDT